MIYTLLFFGAGWPAQILRYSTSTKESVVQEWFASSVFPLLAHNLQSLPKLPSHWSGGSMDHFHSVPETSPKKPKQRMFGQWRDAGILTRQWSDNQSGPWRQILNGNHNKLGTDGVLVMPPAENTLVRTCNKAKEHEKCSCTVLNKAEFWWEWYSLLCLSLICCVKVWTECLASQRGCCFHTLRVMKL